MRPEGESRILKLARRCEKRGGELWVVGGALRDHLARRPHNDIDLLVTGVDVASLKQLAHGTGLRPSGGRLPGSLRAMDRGMKIDFTALAGEGRHAVHDKLERCDYTVNAMARRVGRELLSRQGLIDPYGGQDDLQRGELELISGDPEELLQDPLRISRGLRLIGELGLRPTPRTAELMRAARSAPQPGAQMQGSEFLRAIQGPHGRRALLQASKLGLLGWWLPSTAALLAPSELERACRAEPSAGSALVRALAGHPGWAVAMIEDMCRMHLPNAAQDSLLQLGGMRRQEGLKTQGEGSQLAAQLARYGLMPS